MKPGETEVSSKKTESSPATAEGGMWANPIIAGLPNHLKQFVVDQRYDSYQPTDHAVWRFVMRQNYSFLKEHAHPSYIDGLARTGIGIEQIPSIDQMNAILGKIGWASVTVDGFIPPAAFMEFQAYRVLVIAADIRQIHNLEYTPAPDIIHEAAGHAPIIADHDYAEYLHRFGEIGAKAMSSRKDYELYEAIRHLSILKEQAGADPSEITSAENEVQTRQDNLGKPSEMALLSRLHWWTVEYGLIGTVEEPKLYGAGLLSSIGESTNCLTDSVKKILYSLQASDYTFDIVNQQPQLFVTPDFAHLTDVLEQFADSMAFQVGGKNGLDKAVECRNLGTYVYSSGLQVSGVVGEYMTDENAQPILVRTTGPTQLAISNKEILENSKERYHDGFVSPVGNLAGCDRPIELMTDDDLDKLGLLAENSCEMIFASGVRAKGKLSSIVRRDAKIVIFSFDGCRLTHDGQLLIDSGAEPFDLAVGQAIVSVFGGAADKDAYEQISLVPRERTIRSKLTNQEIRLQQLYARVRKLRESESSSGLKGQEEVRKIRKIKNIWTEHQADHSQDWLLPMEMLEIVSTSSEQNGLASEFRSFLKSRAGDNQELANLIKRGLALIN